MKNYIQKYLDINFEKDSNLKILGNLSFFSGVFLLASAVGISIILLFFSLIVSFLKPGKFFKDKWNFPFFICSILMIISTMIHFNYPRSFMEENLNPDLSLLGLVNWLPFFLGFWGFQNYLHSEKKRIITAKLLICGSMPVIFSGILQLLNINGPFELFNGLIVWFQRPLIAIETGLTGLFNNQNYAGLWMVMIWPFCLYTINKKNQDRAKRYFLFIMCLLFVIFIFLTGSRSAFVSLLISSPIILGSSSLIWFLPTLTIALSIFAITVIPIFPDSLKSLIQSKLQLGFYSRFPELDIKYLGPFTRIKIFENAINFIYIKPIFGWGAATFSILYNLKTGVWVGHPHNLIIELALSYGIFTSIIFLITVLSLLFLAYRKIYRYKNKEESNFDIIFNKAWFTSTLIFLLSHLVDIQYFDARISILFWILFAGLRSFIKDENLDLKNDYLCK